MSTNTDILVLGATGFTGRLIVKYLSNHPQFQSNTFTFSIGARSNSKLSALVKELNVPKNVKLVQVDVTDPVQVEEAVKGTRVVINTVGPFWTWGTPVVRACVKHGKHYVDLTGEPPWMRDIITEFDYAATKTHSIIIPASGLDCIPADLSVYLANKTLKALSPNAEIDLSTSAYKMKGGFSGGTLSTAITIVEEVSKEKMKSMRDWGLSPVKGVRNPSPRMHSTLPYHTPTIHGGPHFMGAVDKSVVHRSWGLNQLWTLQHKSQSQSRTDELKKATYGPKFKYYEMFITPSRSSAIIFSLTLALGALCLFITPIRWLIKKYGPQAGSGPSEWLLDNGFLELTNITSSVATPDHPAVDIKTTIYGQGDPGYKLTAVMISESALALALDHSSLPPMAQQGGVLTPTTALGDVLLNRLVGTGKFKIQSEVLGQEGESRKNV